MLHPTYLAAGVIALVAALVAAFALRRKLLKTEDSPATKKWFGCFVGGLGTLNVLAYYVTENPTPDSLAMGWALAVFGGYMVESGRLRQRILELESKIDSLGASASKRAS